MTAVTVMWIGAAMLVSGIFELFGAIRSEGWKAGLLAFLGGALSIVAGGVLLARPALGAGLFAILLTALKTLKNRPDHRPPFSPYRQQKSSGS